MRQKKRKREAGETGHDPDPVSREGSAEKATAGIQKKTNRSKAKGGDKVQGRDGSSERLPPGSGSAKPHTEEQRRDVAKQKDREKSGEAPKAPQARDLPALKKKRHLLYGQLQEARQEVCQLMGFRVWGLGHATSLQQSDVNVGMLTAKIGPRTRSYTELYVPDFRGRHVYQKKTKMCLMNG